MGRECAKTQRDIFSKERRETTLLCDRLVSESEVKVVRLERTKQEVTSLSMMKWLRAAYPRHVYVSGLMWLSGAETKA